MDNDKKSLGIRKIGLLVRSARVIKEMSQKELAEAIDVHPHYISLVETGRKSYSLGTLLAIIDVLDFKMEIILSNDDDFLRKKIMGRPSS